MKLFIRGNSWAVLAVVTAIGLASCAKQEEVVTPSEPVPAETPAPAPTPIPEPEPEPEPAPVAATGIEGKLNGYWAPDKEGMLKIIQDAIAQQSGGDAADPAAMAMATQMVEGMLGSMVASVQDGKSMMYSPNGIEESSYTVSNVDEASGQFTMETTNPDGSTESANCQLDGDILSLNVGGQPIILSRIDEAEFKKRKAAIESAPAPTLPPGVPAPTPPPAPGN